MGIEPIKTKRFVLTKMTAADGDKYFRISNNANVMKYVTGYSLSRTESDEMLKGFLAEYGSDTYLGRYLIESLENGELIGAAKLDRIGSEIEIGYRVVEEQWGKGIATEIADGLIRFARKKLDPSKVIAFVNVNNSASIRVLEKAGMVNVETIEDLDKVKYKFVYLPAIAKLLRKIAGALSGFFR
ncbi:GNAT family N-acetyltransferase [Dyadobacter sediminis]|uniref:GNAT family N-acetyltransferase n=1 Tax=Dyadobacter sediminis TaxID=1493691 RepID=A0A5R9K9G7_9BACT|nr:GNAT family N-acetyltransferase [Dyadobacter sediminis]TLU90675.1 GNAT family N-acetyltransferase [Dyadobacter sediminis]GGC09836.1 hypothetical protein GCM10011325_40860 [Dyadobacter sediminis]